MANKDLVLLKRKEIIGTIAVIAWLFLALITITGLTHDLDLIVAISIFTGCVFTIIWIGMDAAYRKMAWFGWVILTVFLAPIGIPLYFLVRSPVTPVCYQCGTKLVTFNQRCPVCGWTSAWSSILKVIKHEATKLTDSLSIHTIQKARNTTKEMAIALACVVFFGYFFKHNNWFISFIWALSFSAYWILVSWWVYLDASWRRMDTVPWAILTLITNIFGLVTYLVIRYPEPRTCPRCQSYLKVGLKYCPFCGAETDLVCPRCQSPVKADWVFCPSCAAQLPAHTTSSEEGDLKTIKEPVIAITGNVNDALSGSPISSAEVKIDSKTEHNQTYTDAQGRYTLMNLKANPYVIIASAEGYSPKVKGYTPDPEKLAPLHFNLYPVTKVEPVVKETASS